jgi:hypothetical protein
MFTPETWKEHKYPTVVSGHAIAECLDPLGEAWLILEKLIIELLEEERIVYEEDTGIEIGSMWAS